MRLVIDAPTYATAAQAFTTAHQVAAIQYDALVGKLGSFGGMAGDDSTSAQFAAAYDEAADEAVSALADLVPSFANLGRLAGQSAANHRAANAGSVLTGNLVFDGTWLPDTEVLSVLPATPPTSLGGDPAGFSDQENWILDHIEGFVWPNADTDRLRDAAHVWRSAADGLAGLTDNCRDAVSALDTQRSPEIPLAIAATEELGSAIGQVAEQLSALGAACEEYAAHVEARRDEIRALLREILNMVVEGLVISAAIGLITGGAGAVAGTSAVVARVAAQAPRFAAILAGLRAAVAGSAAYLRTTHTALRASRLRLVKFTNARLAMRNEFGHLAVGAPRRWRPGWLATHEHDGSHTLLKHVGQSREELAARMNQPRPPQAASTFPDQGTAETAISRLMDQNTSRINSWLDGPRDRLVMDGTSTSITGARLDRAGNFSVVRGLRVIIDRDAEMPHGFRIWTAYPTP